MKENIENKEGLSIWYFIGLGLLVGGSLFALYTLISDTKSKKNQEALSNNEIKRLKNLIEEADELMNQLKAKEKS